MAKLGIGTAEIDSGLAWSQAGPVGEVTDSAGNPAGAGRYFPQVLTVRGNTYAVWCDSRVDDPFEERNRELMLRVSGNDGRSWGPLHNISAAPAVGDDWGPAALAASDSSVLVAFATVVIPDAAGSYLPSATTIVRVTGADGNSVDRRRMSNKLYNLALAGTGNGYYLVGNEAPTGRLMVSRSTDDGATFGDPRPVFTPDWADGCVADVAAVGNQVVVAFLNPSSGEHGNVWATASNDAGATWSPARAITDTAQREYPPTVHLEDGVATVAWQSVRSGSDRTLDVATSTDGGTSWTAPATIATHRVAEADSGYDYRGPWTAPKFSGAGGVLTLYSPLSPGIHTSADHGLTWQSGVTVPNGGQGVVHVNRGARALFAWKAQDAQSWIGSDVNGLPAAPTGVAAELIGPQTARVTWQASATAASDRLDGYAVHDQTGRKVASAPASQTSAAVSGLDWGVAYTFTVSAENAAGPSDLSAASNPVTPTGAPSRPAKPTVTVRGRKVTVRWQPADARGSRVVRYVVESSAGSTRSKPGRAKKLVFRRLKPGRYKFRVTAVNAVGSSPASAWVKVRVRK